MACFTMCPSLMTLLALLVVSFSWSAGLQPEGFRVFTTLEHTAALDAGLPRGKAILLSPQTGHQGLLQAAADAYDTQQECLAVTHIWDKLFEAWVEYGPAGQDLTHGDKLMLAHTCQASGPAVSAGQLEAAAGAAAEAAEASSTAAGVAGHLVAGAAAAGAALHAQQAPAQGQRSQGQLPHTLMLAQQQQYQQQRHPHNHQDSRQQQQEQDGQQQQQQPEGQEQQQHQKPPSLRLAQQQHQQQRNGRSTGSNPLRKPAPTTTPPRQEQQVWRDSRQLLQTNASTDNSQGAHLRQQRTLQEAAADSADPQEAAPAGRNETGRAAGSIQAEHTLREALLDGYDRQSFPSAVYGRANVSINLYAHKILQVDLYAGTLRLAVWLAVRWKDPRLAWDPRQHANITKLWFSQEQEATFEIWQPEMALWNSAARMQDTLDLRPMRADYEGNVYWSRNGAVEVACNFEGLSAYPYGPVKCRMEFGSWVFPPAMVDVTPFEGKGYVIGGSLTSLVNAVHVEYNLEGLTAERVTYPYYDCCPDDSNWPVVIYTLTLCRASIIYSLKIMVPQIVLTWVAFSTFWLSPECGERLGLAVTIPLAVAVYDLLVFSSLPTSNRINFVSAMGLLGFLFCVAVLLENALVIQLYYYRESHYMRSWSLLKRTLLSYREQVVWVGVLQVLDQLKLEVAQRQMQRAAPAAANWRNLGRRLGRQQSKPKDVSCGSSSAALGGKPAFPTLQSMQSLMTGRMDAAAVADVAVNGPKQLPSAATDQGPIEIPAPTPPGTPSAAAAVAQEASPSSTGLPPTPVDLHGVGVSGLPPTAVESLLSRQDKDGLQACLLDVLAQPPAEALAVPGSRRLWAAHSNVQRKLRRAVAVFSMERLVARLHPYITGDASATARHAHAAALHTFCEALAIDYNVRWRLLSATIDAIARWVFTLGYVVAVLAVSLSLTQGSYIV